MTPAERFLDSFAECLKIDIGEIYDRAKRYFQQNLSPDEVFTIKQLEEWHAIHSKLKGTRGILLSEARELEPEDVFDIEDLKKWALENGYKKGESHE